MNAVTPEPSLTLSASASRLLVFAAFFAIYILWGTTFLAIRIAVHQVPPLFAAGTRFFLAGILLLAFISFKRPVWPTSRQWRNLALLGLLMFVAEYGPLFWAEQYVPSGVTSLLAATIPLITIVLEVFVLRHEPFHWRIGLSTLLGFAGVAILILPDPKTPLPVIPCLAILAGGASFALGSVLSRTLDLPTARPLTSGASMAIGGATLLLLSGLFGELHPFPHLTAPAIFALLYLILVGSLLAFTAYVWLLSRMPASRVAGYAYVNPIVAVALGFFFAGEHVNLRMLAGAVLVLLSIYLTLRKGKPRP